MHATYLNEETSTALGTVIAIIQEHGFFKGSVTAFTTNNLLVGVNASHFDAHTSTMNFFYLNFPINIQNKRYKFVDGGPVNPPVLRQLKSGAEVIHTPKSDTGHITFDFNQAKGTLGATFNFTFIDSITSKELMFTGEIKAEGLEFLQR
ncbi:hypothetical protein [Pseudomonas frederiksbergensis]|uniref:hypothetical protein n=1 Tax=Pseudomonas frederiksbergensis TaxID=104087 RepID=UPI0011CE7421|nr:hypothetical protein [Pseudomonas frederiksbergensis]